MRATLLIVCALLGACRGTHSIRRPGVERQREVSPGRVSIVEVLDGLPEDPGSFEVRADLSFSSDYLEAVATAERHLQMEAAKVGADAVAVQDLRVIRTIGYTGNLHGVAIRWVDGPTQPAEPRDPASAPQRP